MGPRKTVVLITLDAFRYDHTNLIKKENFPTLYNLLENSFEFETHISTGSGTSTSFPGILASSLPLDYGYRGLNQNHDPLAVELQTSDVRTLGITAQPACSSVFNYDSGFDLFIDNVAANDPGHSDLYSKIKKNLATSLLDSQFKEYFKWVYNRLLRNQDSPYTPADELTDKSIKLLSENKSNRSTFLWAHYAEPHAPYNPPDSIIEKYYDSSRTVREINQIISQLAKGTSGISNGSLGPEQDIISDISSLYKAQLHFGLKNIDRFFAEVMYRGDLENALIILTSDHGEELFDHGQFGHPPELHEELIRVPFYMSTPESRSGPNGSKEVLNNVTSHLDIAPTIVDHLGLDGSSKWRGESLYNAIYNDRNYNRDFAISELSHRSGLGGEVTKDDIIMSVRGKDWKYVVNKQQGTESFYRIDNHNCKLVNPSSDNDAKRQVLQEIIETRIGRISGNQETGKFKMNDEVRERLQDLGYKE